MLQTQKKNLQYITTIRITLFESNKILKSVVSIYNKLLVKMHKFLDKCLSLLAEVSCIISFKSGLENNY